MNHRWQKGKTVVARLRITGERLDPLVTKLRVASLLESLDTSRAGLPPSSILCVRRLRDPRPGSLDLTGRSLAAPPEWRSAFANSLRALGDQAARPLRGVVAQDAQSVIFSDPSELLAALAQDWCEGRVAQRWWWASLYKGEYPDVYAPRAWADSPEYVPAALEHLATNQRLAPFANALSAADARSLLEAVTRAFALSELGDALHEGFHEAHPSNADDTALHPVAAHDTSEAGRARSPAHAHASAPPWRRLAPEGTDAVAGRERQCLLGVGLSLRRAPSFARTPGFARATLRWLEAAAATTRAPATHDETRRADFAKTPASAEQRDAPRVRSAERKTTALDVEHHQQQHADDYQARASAPPESDKAGVENLIDTHAGTEIASGPDVSVASSASATNRDYESRDSETHRRAAETLKSGERVPTPSLEEESRWRGTEGRGQRREVSETSSSSAEGKSEAGGDEDEEGLLEAKTRRGEGSLRQQGASAAGEEEAGLDGRSTIEYASSSTDEALEASGEPEAEHGATVSPEAEVETEFGGLFYLVNVGLFLELYADFTSPLESEAPLPLFDFVGLLGERLLGARVVEDPVWQLLAGLSARGEGEGPGKDFVPPDEWRVPDEWLKPFSDEGAWLWSDDAGRLRVRHPEGFLVLDAPVEAGEDASEKLGRELEAYRACASFTLRREAFADDEVKNSDGLAWWLGRLTPYVVARLRRALGVEDDEEVLSLLFERRARVFVTASHLDVVFALAQLPIEVRLSGLDRNPGWVPAAGRFVAFHYE